MAALKCLTVGNAAPASTSLVTHTSRRLAWRRVDAYADLGRDFILGRQRE